MIDLLKYFSLAPASAAIVLVVLWLFRNWISVRMSESVRHEYNTKIELLKDDNTKNKNKIDSLQSGALTNLALRESLLFERRLKAVENVWNSKCALSKALLPVQMSSMVKWDKIRKEQSNPTKKAAPLKEMGEFMMLNVSVKELSEMDGVNVQKYRLFVPEDIWNYHEAYMGICFDAVVKLESLAKGSGLEYFEANGYNDKLKVIFPELSDHIDEHGEASYSTLLSLLSDKILHSIRSFLSGVEADQLSVDKAKAILKTVESVVNSESKN